MTDLSLPAEFTDLEPFLGWALATEKERYAKRLSSSMEEMQAFYDAVRARGEDAKKYLDGFALDDMPDEAQHLMWMLFSWITVAYPVEVWKQPKVPDTGAASMDRVAEPATFPV